MVWYRPDNAEQRFWANVQKTEHCWIWTGYKLKAGYGRMRGARPTSASEAPKVLAHRFAYELLIGAIPEGAVLDHLCRNPSCVNPAHLDPTDSRTNTMRGLVNDKIHRNTCANGHPYTDENMRRDAKGHRVCRACHRVYQHAARERRKQNPLWTPRRDGQKTLGV